MDLGITPGHPLAFDCRTLKTSGEDIEAGVWSIRSWPRSFVGEPDSIHLNLAVKEAWEPADVTLATPVCIRATSLGLRPTGPLPKNRTSRPIRPTVCRRSYRRGQTCSSRAV